MKILHPKTPNQLMYLMKLQNPTKPILVVNGPAGTGKTLFACQVAAQNLYAKTCKKIVVTRPSVAVDEDLGHLPGDIHDKMSPWTRPIFDVMENYFSSSRIRCMIAEGSIEVCPLGFMRGRTFDESFIVADEMQNSSVNQMKMLLTRLGSGSQMVVTGDTDQCDLGTSAGLHDIVERLEDYREQLKYIDYIVLEGEDVERHPAVKEVLGIYENQMTLDVL